MTRAHNFNWQKILLLFLSLAMLVIVGVYAITHLQKAVQPTNEDSAARPPVQVRSRQGRVANVDPNSGRDRRRSARPGAIQHFVG